MGDLVGVGDVKKARHSGFKLVHTAVAQPAAADHLPYRIDLQLSAPGDPWLRAARLRQVVGMLQVHEECRRDAERLAQRLGHLGAHAPFAGKEQVDRLLGRAEDKGEIALQPAAGLHFFADIGSGVGGVSHSLRHSHVRAPTAAWRGSWSISMIVMDGGFRLSSTRTEKYQESDKEMRPRPERPRAGR